MSQISLPRRENNFDLIRLLLAITVAVVHTGILSNNIVLGEMSQFISSEVAVDSFFVISGFLIFMSFDASTSIRKYAVKRLRRIAPGYGAMIVFCAIVLFFVSSKNVSDYFSIDLMKFLFFNLLTLNFLHPTLPGVFEDNPWQAVNGALWTIKIEAMFYILVPFIALILSKTNKMITLGVIYLLSSLYSTVMTWCAVHYSMDVFLQLEKQLPGQLTFFIAGAWLYYFYDTFIKNASKFLILSVVLLLTDTYIHDIGILYSAALAALVIYLATVFKYLGDFGKFGDLSFGIYIWHFPIIQVFVAYNLFDNLPLGMGLLILSIFSASYLSWHGIEKRFLYPSSHYRIAEKNDGYE